jgi:alpha-L-fucosidase
MWFDGANGGDGYYGGKKEKRQISGSTYYQWPVTLDLVRKMEPEIIFFSDAGPDIRWVGNERGVAGETNWYTISNDTLFAGKQGIEKLLNEGQEKGTKWIPAEVDVSIRPGWFYHSSEDKKVKTPEQLFDIYLTSVGRGSNLLLNIPPDRRGLLNEIDVKSLQGFKKLLDQSFAKNIALNARADASSFRGNAAQFAPKNCFDGNKETYWAVDDNTTAANIEIDLPKDSEINFVVLQEYIKLGQRVKEFSVEVLKGKVWKTIYRGTTIGYKRIVKVDNMKTSKIRVNFLDAKACPVISNIEVY